MIQRKIQFKKSRKGFTLIELVVSIAIFVLITSVVMVSQRKFGGQILITNLGYDIALGIRQAQVYGTSVKATPAGEFNRSYGIHFKDSKYYILFVDLNDNGVYDGTDSGTSCTGGECVSFYRIQQGNSITSICAKGASLICNNIDPTIALDITFKRPDPEPIITTVSGPSQSPPGTYSTAYVVATSPQGLSRKITMLQSGQVSVSNN